MDRRTFLSDISITVAAACTGCLAACGKESGGGFQVNPPSGVNITVDLNTEIPNVGNSVIKQGVIIVRLAETNDPASFTAVQANCTHEGSIIGFNTSQGIFICPNHGSQFNTSGSVVLGPATNSLKKYTIVISGSTMTIA
jgi:cytochrome b6-f complex iron-sulfur subunit